MNELFIESLMALWKTKSTWLPTLGFLHLGLFFYTKNKIKKSLFSITLALLYIFLIGPIMEIIPLLAVDSFHEANHFAINEAFFWLKTIISTASATDWQYTKLWITTYIIYFSLWYICWVITHKKKGFQKAYYSLKILTIISLTVLLPISSISTTAQAVIRSTTFQKTLQNNFHDSALTTTVETVSKGTSVFLYIGESTSSMHMGIYGYPRKTTPKLEGFKRENPHFIVGQNVWSTHTHTTPSLLEALSIPANKKSLMGNTPIYDRKQIPLPSLLKSININTYLFSNQGKAGTWNFATSIIFKDAIEHYSNAITANLGNLSHFLHRYFDHTYLKQVITQKIPATEQDDLALYIFHSYAGHGHYKRFIPTSFHTPVDSYFSNIDHEGIVGSRIKADLLDMIESYDSAISYIDSNISTALNYVKKQTTPMIFVYLSDHGESPYSGRGHDSSRFLAEMAQIPFFVYFNDAAVQENPDLFAKTKKRLENNTFSTLSQLPDTILEFLGIHIHNIADGTTHTPCQIGVSNCNHKDILIRSFGAGYGSIRTRISKDNSYKDLADDATKHNILFRQYAKNDIGICYHRSNSIAKAIRGAALTNCLEVDMVVQNHRTTITHPPANPVGISLKRIAEIAKAQKPKSMTLWIDAKNINTLKNCEIIDMELSKKPYSGINTLLEFPPSSTTNDDALDSCIDSLQKKGVYTSYYIPTNIGSECSTSISNGHSPSESKACKKLSKILNHVKFKQWFTDISFDYRVWTAINNIPAAQHFKWNTWHISAEEIGSLPLDQFRLVIPENADINTR